jgi:formate--tetrahydrofolate ligase
MSEAVARRLEGFEKAGFGHLPVCVAKTQFSFTADPTMTGRRRASPSGCARCGCRPVPGSWWRSAATSSPCPGSPAAEAIRLREDGEIEGLF